VVYGKIRIHSLLALLVLPTTRGKAGFRALASDNLPQTASDQIEDAGQPEAEPTIQHIIDVDMSCRHPNLGKLQDRNQHRNRQNTGNLVPIQDAPPHQQQERRNPKQPESQLIAKSVEGVEENTQMIRNHCPRDFGIRFQGEEKDNSYTPYEEERSKKLRHESVVSIEVRTVVGR
jgi:hypothetical protein